jgi:hypothetical protein
MLNVLNVPNVRMKEAYFFPHWGLGDAIIVNALLRELAPRYEKSYVLCKPSHVESVGFMVRDFATALGIVDEKRFGFMPLEVRGKNVIEIGYSYFVWQDYPGHPYSGRCFYNQFNVDFRKRWTHFRVDRDQAREQAYYDSLNIHEDYIFVHTDPDRGYALDRARLPQGLRVIDAGEVPTKNIFDTLMVLERAKEIHIIESAFEHLIDSFDHWTNKLVLHRYARNQEWVEYKYHIPELRLNWTILT